MVLPWMLQNSASHVGMPDLQEKTLEEMKSKAAEEAGKAETHIKDLEEQVYIRQLFRAPFNTLHLTRLRQ